MQAGDSDLISMQAGFRSHLVGKSLRNVCTVISALLVLRAVKRVCVCVCVWYYGSDHMDIFINQRIECYLNNTIKSSLLNSTHYAVLQPQNGDRIVAIDSVTSFHPVCILTTRKPALRRHGSSGSCVSRDNRSTWLMWFTQK